MAARPLSFSFLPARPAPGQPSPARLDLAHLDAAHLGSARHGSARLGTARLNHVAVQRGGGQSVGGSIRAVPAGHGPRAGEPAGNAADHLQPGVPGQVRSFGQTRAASAGTESWPASPILPDQRLPIPGPASPVPGQHYWSPAASLGSPSSSVSSKPCWDDPQLHGPPSAAWGWPWTPTAHHTPPPHPADTNHTGPCAILPLLIIVKARAQCTGGIGRRYLGSHHCWGHHLCHLSS